MSDNFFAGASKELLKNIYLDAGTLVISDAWRGEPELITFAGIAKKRGIHNFKYLPTDDFQKGFVRFRENGKGDNSFSQLQEYATALIRTAYEQNASDIQIADYGTHGVIKFRCLGMLKLHGQLPGAKTRQLIAVIYGTLSQQGTTSSHTPSVRQDARIARREFLPAQVHSIRVHTEPLECAQAEGGNGCLMLLRLLYDRTAALGNLSKRLEVLGYSASDAKKFRILTERSGLTVISGPTGHGKSTLLKHVMEAQAEEYPEKAYHSIEDPPEYPLNNVNQIMVHTGNLVADPDARGRNYIDAIAGAMRSDPDVLMIGEIRYPDAAVAAIDAALTGHGVWATLHANNALGIILRMISLLNSAGYAEPLEYLCDYNVVAGLVYQRLVPVLCPDCKVLLMDAKPEYRREVLPDYAFERLKKAVEAPENVHIRGVGCQACGHMGFVSQTVAAEVIVTDQEILSHIRKSGVGEAYRYWRSVGGKTFIQDAIKKIEAGLLDPHMTELRLGVPLNFDPTSVEYEGGN